MNRAVARPNAPRSQRTRESVAPTPAEPESDAPRPDRLGSVLCLVGLGGTALFLRGTTAVDVATFGAWGVLLSLAVSVGMDLRRGIHNVVRTDLMALGALYFLTLTEFLVKQGQYNKVAGLDATRTAVLTCICAYAGMVVGRHLIPPTKRHPFQAMFQQPMPSTVLFSIFWVCLAVGFLNMLKAVNFNPFTMVDYFMQPRFAQPWQRGRLGDSKAMLYELSNMILYLVPPLGGILIARRKKYTKMAVAWVTAGVAFTLFYGFSSGTRNIFASYLVTFLIGYCFAASRKQGKEIIVITVASVVALVVSTKVMLDFRDVGKDYIVQGFYKEPSHTQEGQTLAVDNNLYAISRVVEYFPRHHDYTNFEIPYLALIHPIPRVLWPNKPEGMSISVEDIFGADGWTVATSVVGEEWIMHGYVAVFLMSVFFGACCGWWNLLASHKNSEFGILVYASGFFSAVITMRSMNWFSTALLPTAAGLVIGYVFLLRQRRGVPAPVPVRRRIAPAPR
jgi:oligosaccharide repeat unit polymerase